MSWKSKLEAVALFALLILGSFALAIIAHEGTHLLRSTEPHGICFGYCEANGFIQPATAWAIHNNLSRDEWMPTLIGWAVFGFSGIFGSIAFAKLWVKAT